jgi:hypothetical protein
MRLDIARRSGLLHCRFATALRKGAAATPLIRLSRLVILRAAGISDFDRSQYLALWSSRSGFQVPT